MLYWSNWNRFPTIVITLLHLYKYETFTTRGAADCDGHDGGEHVPERLRGAWGELVRKDNEILQYYNVENWLRLELLVGEHFVF